MEIGISVIICAFNSASRLPETIKHLAVQKVPVQVPWEIILVDNASTDDTAGVGMREWKSHHITNVNFRVLTQETPGKAHAYKTGVLAARYEYLINCDDDNHLSENYVANVYDIMTANNQIGVLGGCGILLPEEPAWPEISLHAASYVIGPQHWAPTEHWVYGAGCTARQSVLVSLFEQGWEQISTGRKSAKLLSGEDIEMCFTMYLKGYQIVADDRLTFKHFIPVKRQNIDYILNLSYWLSYSYVLLNSYLMLMENDQRSVQRKLLAWLNFNVKSLVRLTGQVAAQLIIKRKPVTEKQQLALKACLGTIRSIIDNRNKLIRHATLLRGVLANDQ